MPLLGDLDVVMMWSNGPVAATRAGGRREREKDEALQNQKICARTYKIAFVRTPQQPTKCLNIRQRHDVMILDQ